MFSLEKLLDSLLEPTGRPAVRSREAVIQRTLEVALTLTDAHGAVMLLPTGRKAWRHVMAGNLAEPKRVQAPYAGTEFSRQLVRGGAPVHASDVSEDVRLAERENCPGLDAGPALYIPIRLRAQSPGYLAIYKRSGDPRFNDQEGALATLLAAWTAQTIENLRLSKSVERLAVTDDLTQIYNYRFLKSALRREIKRAKRFRQVLSIVMIDVDNLKGYNDKHGHLRGSFLLKQIAGRFASQVRSFDLIAKYGGDEFTLILPQTDRDGALIVAERMRLSVEERGFPFTSAGDITVSLGVSTFPHDAEDANGLIHAADRALYLAKRRGRNRTEMAGKEAA